MFLYCPQPFDTLGLSTQSLCVCKTTICSYTRLLVNWQERPLKWSYQKVLSVMGLLRTNVEFAVRSRHHGKLEGVVSSSESPGCPSEVWRRL
jgi:hypothetical protein